MILIDNVTKKIGKSTVISNISCHFKPNSVTGLKGINGAGKTMLMRLISGLIHPTSGKIIIDNLILGKDITFPPSLGMLLENPSFLSGYSGFANLKMLAGIKNQISDLEIQKVLKTVGLGDNGKVKYRKYSLGMKQRLGIASAIMEKPDILLLDEPINSLDTEGIEMVRGIISKERCRGATLILSCHDTNFLESVCDSIYIMESGQIRNEYFPCLRKEG